MAIKNKLTFLVVTCEKDLLLLDRYLTSVAQYCNLDQLHEILVVFNDEFRYYDNCKQLLGKFNSLPIKAVWSNELWPEQSQYNWNSQQQLKLLASNLVHTEWYIVNDSKDFYYKNIGYEDFISSSGQALLNLSLVTHQDNWFGPNSSHRSQYENAYELFGMRFADYPVALRTIQASVCPLHASTIQQLVLHLRQQFGVLFSWLLLLQINHKAMYTEYALVSAWLQKQELLLQQYTVHVTNLGFHAKTSCNKDLRKGKIT